MADERTTTFKGDPLVLVGPELKAGDKAPDFELTGNDLSAVSLSQDVRRPHLQRCAVARYPGM